MKQNIRLATLCCMISGFSFQANAQTLGKAKDYDIFVTNKGSIELKDSNQLKGKVGYAKGIKAKKNEKMQKFEGSVHVHSKADFSRGNGFEPSGGVFTSGFDSELEQADADLTAYTSYLDSLTADLSFSKTHDTSYSLATAKALTVIDFKEIDTQNEDFSFTGRAGQSDQIIIRISKDFTFEGGNINLVNLGAKDVVWYLSGNDKVDLHRGDSIFKGTIIAPDGAITLGETDFTGAVYGNELKLGSGFSMQGNSIPEPSTVLFLTSAASCFLIRRRRKD